MPFGRRGNSRTSCRRAAPRYQAGHADRRRSRAGDPAGRSGKQPAARRAAARDRSDAAVRATAGRSDRQFAKWIAMGAPDPRDGACRRADAAARRPLRSPTKIAATGRFSRFAQCRPPTVARCRTGSRDDLDRFVLATTRTRGTCGRAPAADKYALLRRTTYRAHRPAADARRDCGVSSPTTGQRRLKRSSIGCWRRRSSACIGDGTGWTACGMRTASTSRVPTATGSSGRSTAICRTTSSSGCRSPAT